MTEKDEEYEFEQLKRSSSHKEESTSSGGNNGRKDYLEVIDIIESLMQDKGFPIKNESNLTINKIIFFLNKETSKDRNFTEAWLIKGTVLYKTGKYSGAIDAFDSALETMSKEISEEKMDLWKKGDGVSYRYALKFKAFAYVNLEDIGRHWMRLMKSQLFIPQILKYKIIKLCSMLLKKRS